MDCARFPHLDFDFLQPNRIRDADGRLASDPDYCPRTLYVPEAFLKKQTPGTSSHRFCSEDTYRSVIYVNNYFHPVPLVVEIVTGYYEENEMLNVL